MAKDIRLAEMVSAIRTELESLDRSRIEADRQPLLELEDVELQIRFGLTEGDSMKGGFDLKVIALGGASSTKTEEIHTATIRFKVASSARAQGVPGTRAHSKSAQTQARDIKPIK